MSETSPLARLDLFVGEATDTQCRVYARVEAATGKLSGSIIGPECAYAQTLSASVDFIDRGPGKTLLAEAMVPDPCFWSPELPHLYSIDMQLHADGRNAGKVRRLFGMRRMGTRGRNLIFERERWVLRGISQAGLAQEPTYQWHQAVAAMLVDSPSDDLCEEASRVGVLLVATLTAAKNSLADELRRLSRWPAVGIVAFRRDPGDLPLRSLAPNVLIGEWFDQGAPVVPASWASVALCRVGDAKTFGDNARDCRVPIIAIRSQKCLTDIVAARAQIDQFQADLAPGGDYAGYAIDVEGPGFEG